MAFAEALVALSDVMPIKALGLGTSVDSTSELEAFRDVFPV